MASIASSSLEQVDNSARLHVSSLQPLALRSDNLWRKCVQVGFNEQVTCVQRRNFTNVKLFVERFAIPSRTLKTLCRITKSKREDCTKSERIHMIKDDRIHATNEYLLRET